MDILAFTITIVLFSIAGFYVGYKFGFEDGLREIDK